MTSIYRRIWRYVYGILAVPFAFVMGNVIPKSPCYLLCTKDSGQAIIDYFVNFFTGNGLIPQWVYLVAFPAWVGLFILVKVIPPLFRPNTKLKSFAVMNIALGIYNIIGALNTQTLAGRLYLGGMASFSLFIGGLGIGIAIVIRKPKR
jgi:hypothetical protein